MGKQHSKAADKPLLLIPGLPRSEHEKAVQILAIASAMDAAFACAASRCNCKQKGFINHLDSFGQLGLVFYYTRLYSDPKVFAGVNDRVRFQDIFTGIVPRGYSGFLAFLQCNPHAIAALASLNNRERLTTLKTAAEAQLHLLSLPSDNPLPLTWPAPEQKKSEVL